MKVVIQNKKSVVNQPNKPFIFIIIVISFVLIFTFLIQNSSIFYRKSITMPFSLHLNKQDLVMAKGEEFHLRVFAINKRVSFSSTNFRVAGVNFNGRIFAYQTGKAFILAKVDNKVLKCRVHVIDINKDKLTLKTGDTYHLKITGISSATKWHSSNPKVATVNLFGKVKAKKKGYTVITGMVKGKEVKCKVWVK